MKLSDVANRINGNVDRFTTDLQYYIGGEHFDSNELAITRKGNLKENLNILGFKFHFAFQERDVIFMARNPHLRKAGMVMFSGLCSDASYIVRTKDENVLSQDYLACLLQTDHFWDYCESHKVGSVNFAINYTTFANYEFDLPPIEKQREIAAKVWAAYRVKESYRQLLATTDDMLKAKFQKIQKGATEQKLGEFIEIVRGVSYKPTDIRSEQNDNADIILRANNISNGSLSYDDIVYVDSDKVKEVQLLRKGDVLMCASSGSQEHVGKVALVDKNYADMSFGAFCLVVRTKNIESEYLLSLLMSKAFRNQIEMMCNGTNILNVRRDYIEEWICPIADRKIQQQFVAIAMQAEATKASLRESIASIDRVIRSLINQ